MENPNHLNNTFNPIGFGLLSGILVIFFYVAGSALILVFENFEAKDPLFPFLFGLSQLLFMLLPTIILARVSQLETLKILRFNFDINSKQLFIAFAGFIGFQLFTVGYLSLQESIIPLKWMEYYKELMKAVEDTYGMIIYGDTGFDLFRSLLIAAFIPAISEELFFRGFLQYHFEKGSKPFLAIFITSLIFAIIHFNFVQFIPLLGIGLFLGLIAYRTGNIILPIIIHFTNNALAVSTYHFSEISDIEEASETLPWEYSLPFLIIGLVVVFLSIKYIGKNKLSNLE